MKLIILILSIFLISCGKTNNINKDKALPLEIATIEKSKAFDTLICIKTDEKIYIFEENKYKETINTKTDDDFGIGVWVGVLLLLLIVGLFEAISD